MPHPRGHQRFHFRHLQTGVFDVQHLAARAAKVQTESMTRTGFYLRLALSLAIDVADATLGRVPLVGTVPGHFLGALLGVTKALGDELEGVELGSDHGSIRFLSAVFRAGT